MKNRLYYLAERNHLLRPNQSGFRGRFSVTDQVARLENQIRVGLVNRKSVVTVFLDLRAAYDLVPHYPLLKMLKDMGISGRLSMDI